MLSLQRNIDKSGSSRPDDFQVFEDEQRIGRLYRASGGGAWMWSVSAPAAPAGLAPTREIALAALKAAWAGYQLR